MNTSCLVSSQRTQIQKDYTVSQKPLIRTDKDVDRRVSTGKNTGGRQKPERYTSFSAGGDHLVPWVSERPVSPRLPGGKDPFWQGFQCEEKKMERAVDEDHDFGGMCVKLGQVKRLGRVV